jgi:hypothetical protein
LAMVRQHANDHSADVWRFPPVCGCCR